MDKVFYVIQSNTAFPGTDFPVSEGLHSRYTYSSWNSSSNLWTDEAGGNEYAESLNIFTECSAGANGAGGKVCELRGTTNSRLYFGPNALPEVFTMCSVTRYAGIFKKAILSGPGRFYHGHYYGSTGVAQYDKWMTNRDNRIPAVETDWLIFCGQNAAPWHFYANGEPVGIINSGITFSGNIDLGINVCFNGCEFSDFGIVELAIWNRTLSRDEILSMNRFYSNMLAAGNLGETSDPNCA